MCKTVRGRCWRAAFWVLKQVHGCESGVFVGLVGNWVREKIERGRRCQVGREQGVLCDGITVFYAGEP